MNETPYYAKDGKVWKRSVETKHDDGSSSFTLEFPICEASELVGENGAASIAGLMNLGEEAQNRPAEDALVTALKYARRFLNSDDHDTAYVDALIAKHKETTG